MGLDRWQKLGIAGLSAVGMTIFGVTGLQFQRNSLSSNGSKNLIQVHVSGAVRQQGVVQIATGSRVSDAIQAAGGTARGADTSSINLAETCVDGMKIEVGNPNSLDPNMPQQSVVIRPEGRSTAFTSSARSTKSLPTGSISLNRATAQELESLPGVGPALASRILSYRSTNGPFRSVDQLAEVKGIGPKKLEQIRPYVQP